MSFILLTENKEINQQTLEVNKIQKHIINKDQGRSQKDSLIKSCVSWLFIALQGKKTISY